MRGIRVRLLVTYMAVSLLAVLLPGLFFIRSVRLFYLDTLRQRLTEEARVTGELLKPLLLENSLAYDRLEIGDFLGQLGQKTSARITLVAPDGVVIGDSAKSRDMMENHLTRPEILAAREGRVGEATRFSTTVNAWMFYIAVSMEEDGRRIGYLRLALPLSSLNLALFKMQATLLSALLVTLAVTTVISLKLSARLTRPLEQVADTLGRISRGNLESRIYLSDRDEIGHMAQALNQMAEAMEMQVRELRENKEKLEAILSAMVEGIVFFDGEDKVVLMNPAAEKMLGTGSAGRLGRHGLELLRNAELHEKTQLARREHKVFEHELELLFPEKRILAVSIVPLKHGQYGGTGVICVFHDITRLRRLEKVRADFAANVSHEMRTPLTAIRGFAETLLDGAYKDPEASERFIRVINREAGKLNSLIEDILLLSQIENKEASIHIAPVDMVFLVKELLETFSARTGKHLLLTDLEGKFPPVAGDKVLLGQALANLLDNALKYTPEGGKITVGLRHEGDWVRIFVSDTGIGIPAQAQDRIFERFYRVDRARSRRLGGTGLGLAIVKHIVEAHQGQLELASEEGKGTTVAILLHPWQSG